MNANFISTILFLTMLPLPIAQANPMVASREPLQSSPAAPSIELIQRAHDLALESAGQWLAIFPLRDGNAARQQFMVTNTNPQEAIKYNDRGIVKFKSGDNYGAILEYDRAISINPKYTESYVNRGIAKFKLGKNQAAILDYDRAIEIDPQDVEAYYHRGIAQFEIGDNQAAMLDFDRAIAINPQDPEVFGNRGAVKSTLGDKQGAIADLTQSAKLFKQQGQLEDYQKMMEMVRRMSIY